METHIGLRCECMTEDTKTALLKVLDFGRGYDEKSLEEVENRKLDDGYTSYDQRQRIKAIRKDISIIDLVKAEVKKTDICPRKK